MKNRKNKLTYFLKIGTFFFIVSLLLINCERDFIGLNEQENLNLLKPKIESFTLNQLKSDTKFKELKSNYKILQNNNFNENSSARSVDTLGITIDENSIKKITGNNYVSYTMLMIEPEDDSGNYSNLVIQEKEGIQRIFTVRYSFNNTASRSTSENTTRDVQMRSGIHQLWNDDDSSGGEGSGGYSDCEEYTTVCNTVNVWIPIPCGCGHLPNQGCTGSTCGSPLYPYHDLQTQEECEDICVWEGYNDQTGNNNNNSTGGAGTTSNNTNPIDVATSPVDPNGVTPYEYINNTLSLQSPFNVDMTQVLDSIALPANDSTKIANQKFLCIYNKVAKSPKFKDLFTNVFGSNKNINARFVLSKDFPTNSQGEQSNGNCRLENYSLNSNGTINSANVLIKINQNKLTAGNPRDLSSILIAKTIIHEAIHAYLSIKRKDCSFGITLDELNNLEFEELIEEYYDGTCANLQEQHEFMFDYIVPILSEILSDTRDDLIPASQINNAQNDFLYVNSSSIPFNWDDFFFNISLDGLHNTESFFNEIENNTVKNETFIQYVGSFAKLFSKSCND